MPCRFASSGTVATSRSASRAILALNVASNFLRDLVISVLHPLRQSRTLHTLTFGPISGVHFTILRMRPTAVRLQSTANGLSLHSPVVRLTDASEPEGLRNARNKLRTGAGEIGRAKIGRCFGQL